MLRRLVVGLAAVAFAALVVVGLVGCGSNPINPLTVTPCEDGDTTCVSTTFALFVDNTPVPDAVQNDFSVEERAVPSGTWASRSLCCFDPPDQTGAATASVAMVLDRSGSMIGQKTTDLNDAAHLFVSLMRTNDRTEIIDFESTVTVSQVFTSDTAALDAAIDAGVAGGSTAAWDGASQGVTDVVPETSDVRAVLLMTDGEDNNSSTTRSALIAQAQSAGIPIYTVAFQAGATAEADLQAIANQTGGRFWAPVTAEELQDAFQQISEAVQNTYEICWLSELGLGSAGEVRITYNGSVPPIEIVQSFTVSP